MLVHVGVRASNLEETIRFWRDGLGLAVVAQTEHRFDLSDGYHNFRVFQHQGATRPPHVSGMVDYLHIGVVVPDLVAGGQWSTRPRRARTHPSDCRGPRQWRTHPAPAATARTPVYTARQHIK